jgi:pyruvate formate lyase activating enzyme
LSSVSATAPIARIILSSAVDGPGNRVAIFTQGCNFDCVYCHNPETIPIAAASAYGPEGAQWMDTHEAARIALAQRPFATGLTLSGGECSLHRAFAAQLCGLAREGGLSTLADSNGSVPFSSMPELVGVLDGVLLDVKAWDNEEHRRVTGSGNEVVLENLAWLAREGLLVEVRTVVSPGLFDAEETVREVSRLLSGAKASRFGDPVYRLIAFRPQGTRPESRGLAVPDPAFITRLAKLALDKGARRVQFSM